MKKFIAAFLSVMMTGAIFVACKPTEKPAPTDATAPIATQAPVELSQEDRDAKGGGDIYAYIGPQTETIDPTKNSTLDGAVYILHLNEPLMRYAEDGSGVTFGVAESMTPNEDGTVYTVKLRDNAKWSDGKAVTAEDFVYTYQRLVNPATVAPYAQDFGKYFKNGLAIAEGKIKDVTQLGVKAIDERTLEITLEGPCAFFDEILAFPTLSPVRKDMVEKHGDKWATSPETYISNGAFKMQTYTLDSEIVVVPNENYWRAEEVVKNTIHFKLLSDNVTALGSLRSGEIQFGRNVPTEETAALKEEGLYQNQPQLGTYYVSYQNAKAPFDNPLVRKAFSYAIDNSYITDVVRQGIFKPLTAVVGFDFPDVDENKEFRTDKPFYIDISKRDENIKIAKEALAEAGYPNGEGFPKVEYILNSGAGHDLIAQALQAQWKEVLNVDVEIAISEWSTFVEKRRKGDFQLARNGWITDYKDPSSMLGLFTSTSANNDGKYSNKEFDAQMDIAIKSGDKAERYAAMHKAEDILMGDYGILPLYNYSGEWTQRPELKNVGYTPVGYWFFHQAYVEK